MGLIDLCVFYELETRVFKFPQAIELIRSVWLINGAVLRRGGWGGDSVTPSPVCYLQQWILHRNPPYGEFHPSYLNIFFILILTSSSWTSHKLWTSLPDALYSSGKVKNHFSPAGRIGIKFAFCLAGTWLAVLFLIRHLKLRQELLIWKLRLELKKRVPEKLG